MSGFLEELADLIQNCEVGGVSGGTGEYDSENDIEVDLALNKIDSLGENAHKMLEIGILQDELAKLGFKHHSDWDRPGHCDIPSNVTTMTTTIVVKGTKRTTRRICVTCWDIYAVLFREYGIKKQTSTIAFYFSSPTFHEDVINKVKGLIND